MASVPIPSKPDSGLRVALEKLQTPALPVEENRFLPTDRLHSKDWFKKLNWLNAQGMSQSHDVHQTNIPFTSFNATDIVSMQVGQLRQRFLGKALLRPQFADPFAEYHARVGASHLRLWCDVNTMSSTHYECDITKCTIQPLPPGRDLRSG